MVINKKHFLRLNKKRFIKKLFEIWVFNSVSILILRLTGDFFIFSPLLDGVNVLLFVFVLFLGKKSFFISIFILYIIFHELSTGFLWKTTC